MVDIQKNSHGRRKFASMSTFIKLLLLICHHTFENIYFRLRSIHFQSHEEAAQIWRSALCLEVDYRREMDDTGFQSVMLVSHCKYHILNNFLQGHDPLGHFSLEGCGPYYACAWVQLSLEPSLDLCKLMRSLKTQLYFIFFSSTPFWMQQCVQVMDFILPDNR